MPRYRLQPMAGWWAVFDTATARVMFESVGKGEARRECDRLNRHPTRNRAMTNTHHRPRRYLLWLCQAYVADAVDRKDAFGRLERAKRILRKCVIS